MNSREKADALSREVIGVAIEVHRVLGPGLLESAYAKCLEYDLTLRKIPFQREVDLPLEYKGILLDCNYRIDLLVDDCLIVELKTVEALLPIHEAQLLTYLRLKKLWLGLLINFKTDLLKNGIKRMVNG